MSKIIARNKKALHNYQILDKFEAGVELKGTEVKSIRAGKININDSFARILNGQVFLYNCHISPYESASWDKPDATRTRRLLLKKIEINKLTGYYAQKGLALVPLDAHWHRQLVKITLGVGRGKAKSDKRQDLKAKAEKRDAQRATADFIRKKR